MAKPITLSFPEKTASELASRLGVSKARKKRIFTIVAEAAGNAKSRAHQNGRLSARPRRRGNAKVAR